MLLTLPLAACGYGDIQRVAFGTTWGSDSAGTRTAILAHYLEQQPAAGLRAFPDGGKPRVLQRGVLVHLCDARERTVRRLGVVPEPASDFNIAPRAFAWDSTGFTVAIGRAASPIPWTLTRIDTSGVQHSAGETTTPPEKNDAINPWCRAMVDSITDSPAGHPTQVVP